MNGSKSGEITGIIVQLKMGMVYTTKHGVTHKPLYINFISHKANCVGLCKACLVLFSKGIKYD